MAENQNAETVEVSAGMVELVKLYGKAIDKAKAVYFNDCQGDSDKARKMLLAAMRKAKPEFKANKTGTPEKRIYDAIRKQFNLFEQAETGKQSAEYDAQKRYESIIKECAAHLDLADLLQKHFAPVERKRAVTARKAKKA